MNHDRRFDAIVQIRWDSEELKAIDYVAERMGLTRSDFIRDAVASYVEREWTRLEAQPKTTIEAILDDIRRERSSGQ